LALSHLDYRIKDDALREKLTPTYPLGCKRTLVTSDFYKSLVRDPVDLVTEPIARVTRWVMTTDGVEHRVDAIVWATGFRASDYLQGSTSPVSTTASCTMSGATLQRRTLG